MSRLSLPNLPEPSEPPAPPPTTPALARLRRLSRLRQIVETAFRWLEEPFGLQFPRARSHWGLLARLGAKVSAFNVAAHVNYLVGRPHFAFFNPLS